MSLVLVTGGTRSGKSAHAERLAHAASSGGKVLYIATADQSDATMTARIAAHRARRPAHWSTIVADDELASAASTADCSLIDGLGGWIAAVMHRAGAFDDRRSAESDAAVSELVRDQIEQLVAVASTADVIVVAEQAGSGLLPLDAATRFWLDLLGAATQRLARAAVRSDLVIAGRVVALPGDSTDDYGALRRHGDGDVRPGEVDHAVNILAGGPPVWLRTALAAALADDVKRYPDETAAMAALAARYGRLPSEIVPTNGAAEALWLLPTALRPTLAACVHPGFTEAEAALRAHGIPVTRVLRDREADFAIDPQAIPAAADLVIVGNPASPSGTLAAAATILALRRAGRVVVVDEAFMEFVPDPAPTLISERLDDVIVVRSLTKALSVPGLRVGYAVCGQRLAARMRAVRPPWAANTLALAALGAAANHPHELTQIAARVVAERDDLAVRLSTIAGVRSWPSVANFCLVEVADGDLVAARLREHGIAVRPAGSFPGLDSRHIRITARDARSNARLAAALSQAVTP